MAQHKHYWSYQHVVYEGRSERSPDHAVNEVGVVRYCSCGVKQMAFTRKWQKPPKSYDLSDVGHPPTP